jgi:hypothetical protein
VSPSTESPVERFQASERAWATVGIALAPVALVGFGLAHVWRGGEVLGWRALAYLVVLGFFAFMAWLRLGGVRRGRPTLLIDVQGIDYARFKPIPWSAVRGLTLAQSSRGSQPIHLLALHVEQPLRYLGTQGWQALQRRQLAGAAQGELFIPLDPLDRPAEQIAEAARAFRRRAGDAGLDEGWRPEALPSRDSRGQPTR